MALTRALKTTLLMLCCLFSLASHGQSTLQLYNEQAVIQLDNHFAYLVEQNGRLSIEQAIQKRGEFRWHIKDNPNFGIQTQGVWLTNKISNVSDINEWMVSLPFSQLDRVEFYLVKQGEIEQISVQGKLMGTQLHRYPTFAITLDTPQPMELYLRVESHSSSVIVPLDLSPKAEFEIMIQADGVLWGFFYGGLFILALYNLVLYVGVREQSLLSYVMYIMAVILWQFVWGGHMHLIFDGAIVQYLGENTSLLFIVIGIASGIFTVTFLETKHNSPSSHPVVMALLVLQGAFGLLSLPQVVPGEVAQNLILALGAIAICSYIFAGFEAYSNNFKPAQYFIFAWGMLALCALVGMSSLLGLLPSNAFTTYCFQVGVFAEAGLFSYALMEKSRRQLESEIEQATNDLRHNMELIEEQNVRLDLARKDAIQASQVKSQFLANMSHEIRTPLNAILGFSKELNNKPLSPENQEQVAIINNSADSLLGIVNDVLDFSKIEAGKLQINNQPFAPNTLLEEMVAVMAKSAHEKNLEFIFELGTMPEKLVGDAFRLKQILTNLLGNALKFTSQGWIKLSVNSEAKLHGIQELTFKVEDSGIGISEQDKEKLFTAFTQVDDSVNRSYQGTGLGLVISRELVHMMRGSMNMQSTPNVGTCFEIVLRMNQLSQKFVLAPTNDWMGKTLVLFDPEPITRRASSNIFKQLGVNLITAESLDFLQTIEQPVDYFIAVAPLSKTSRRQEMLQAVSRFNAHRSALFYSGHPPAELFPEYVEQFDVQLRMPVTLTKLGHLLDRPVEDRPKQLEAKRYSLPKVNILAVDDMEMNLKLLVAWLKDSAVNLTTVMSGHEAIELCHQHEYDLILMDVQMPVLDGVQTAKQIRKTELNIGTPIVAVTAHAFKEEQERLLASGMDDYLPKPIDELALLEVIKRWCHTDNIDPAKFTPSFDWNTALKKANYNEELAKELANDFIMLLPATVMSINEHWQNADYTQLLDEIHKLHGASCYTGVPKLRELLAELEKALKMEQYATVGDTLPAMMLEAEQVQNEGLQS